jgi:glycosyltransferase involved in cell wall biosynthesis
MKFTIAIPTLNRAYALSWSIKSVFDQKGNHDFMIIVSDNCSDDNTKDIIRNFGSEKIKYISPPKRLSMSKHWEFVSDHLTKDDGYIMYIGDDDVLCSSTFNIATHIFSNFDVEAMKGGGAYYYTPDAESPFAGYLLANNIVGAMEIRNSTKFLRDVADFKSGYGYTSLPALYHGFVKASIIAELKERGPLFNKAAPDVYSAINIASLDINYAYLKYPLVLGVSSKKSNGLNVKNNTEIGKNFITSSTKDFNHKYIVADLSLLEFHVLDCLEDVLSYLDNSLSIKIDYQNCYKRIIRLKTLESIKKGFNDLKKISSKTDKEIYIDLLRPFLVLKVFRFLLEKLFGKDNLVIYYFYLRYFFLSSFHRKSKPFYYFRNMTKKNIYDPLSCKTFLEQNTESCLVNLFSIMSDD